MRNKRGDEMIFLCGEGLPVPVSCPICGFLPLVYEREDGSFCVECVGKVPFAHTFSVSAEDEQTAFERWLKVLSAPSSASDALHPDGDGSFCDYLQ